MTHAPLRLMYWPNEPVALGNAGLQAGPRRAFEAMTADGTISALSIFPFHGARADAGSVKDFTERSLATIRDFRPDLLFVQHVAGIDVPEQMWLRLRAELPAVTLIYHEGDAYDRRIKRLDSPTKAILRHADLIFAVGLGALAGMLQKVGGKTVEYLPHSFDRSRFGRLPEREDKRHDIAMIGNSGALRRLPLLYVPGGRRRARLARALTTNFGQGFALYGAGWSGLASTRGRIAFDQQERALQRARISANWDHFDTIDWYFSDRLPISLAAGVPHVTSYHRGYEHLFADCPGLYACRTVEEAVDTCRWLLSLGDARLAALGVQARAWAFANLEAETVYRRAIERASLAHRGRVDG